MDHESKVLLLVKHFFFISTVNRTELQWTVSFKANRNPSQARLALREGWILVRD